MHEERAQAALQRHLAEQRSRKHAVAKLRNALPDPSLLLGYM